MLHQSCYNCHSEEGNWPWYAHFWPGSKLLEMDVHDGRARLVEILAGGAIWHAGNEIRACPAAQRNPRNRGQPWRIIICLIISSLKLPR